MSEEQYTAEDLASTIVGFFERADNDFVSGWVLDQSDPTKKLTVSVELDGEEVLTIPAEKFRQDLKDANLGDGACSFMVATSFFRSKKETAKEIVVKIAGTSIELAGSPKAFPEMEIIPAAPALAVIPPPDIIGNLDEVGYSIIRGWAFDRNKPDVPVSLDLYIDGEYILRADASLYRQDLQVAGFGSGHCAFLIPPPIKLFDGRPHLLRLAPSNTVGDLPSSPQVVTLASATPAHYIARLQSKLASLVEEIHRSSAYLNNESRGALALERYNDIYKQWYDRYVKLTVETREMHLRRIAGLKKHPVVSILMPTYNTDPRMLRAAVESVRSQLYPHWQLCIVDDCSTNEETRKILTAYAKSDVRIRVKFRDNNGHISEATNDAIKMAEGEYVAFMDHDDELTEDALSFMVQAIDATDAPLLYSDENKIDKNGNPYEPHFKPAFNYTLLLSYNYICHFVVAKKSYVTQVGGLRTETNGSQDHDLLLRLTEIIPHDEIVHVPHVLYNWRSHEASTASAASAKSYVVDAGITAISSHLNKMAPAGTEVVPDGSYYRVKWPQPEEKPLVSIVIPTRDSADILTVCLTGLLSKTDYQNFEIIIVNNGSVEDKTFKLFEEVSKDPRVKIVDYDQPFNYSAICNFGVKHCAGSMLLMLNNDIEATTEHSGWLGELVAQVSRPGIGAAGAKLLYPNGKIQHAGVILGIGGVAGHSHKFSETYDYGYFSRIKVAQELTACTAACLLIRRDVFDAIDGFDEINLPVSFNDVDLCLRIRESGWCIVYTPFAELIHHESYSRGPENTPAKVLRSQKEVAYMRQRWAYWLDADPAYSPSLTIVHEDFSVDSDRGPDTNLVFRYSSIWQIGISTEIEKGLNA